MPEALLRPPPSATSLRRDIWLALAILIGALISMGLSSVVGLYGTQAAPLQWSLLAVLGVSVPIAFRRRFPITVAIVVCTVYFVAVTARIPELYAGNASVFISLYTVGAWVNDRRRAAIARIVLIAGMFVWLLSVMFFTVTDTSPELEAAFPSQPGFLSPLVAYWLIQLIINIAYFGGAYYLGDRAYRAALQLSALDQRQQELERERAVTAAQAVALDRITIARELHDVVAHHVSAMGVQAGAARAVLSSDPDAARAVLHDIEDSARAAISELHQLLSTLRTPADAGGSDATLRLDQLPALVARADEVGMPSTLTVIGDPRAVPDVAQAALYRIAQEAITNARRHGGTAADVRLRYSDAAVELEVSNTGRAVHQIREGLGVQGMRERAAAAGGSIELGARSRGGFLVRVRVPLQSEPVRA